MHKSVILNLVSILVLASVIYPPTVWGTELFQASRAETHPLKGIDDDHIHEPIASPVIHPSRHYEEDYILMIQQQQHAFTDSDEELYLAGDQIWQRLYGEHEFFLAPTVSDIGAYLKRIRADNERERGTVKSTLQFVHITPSAQARQLLGDMGITLPPFVLTPVLVMLPSIDIEQLLTSGVTVTPHPSYGTTQPVSDVPQAGNSRATIWSEGFEGSMANYATGDDDPDCGLDYWRDVNCESYSGSWSVWSAGVGDQPWCQNYDCWQDAYIRTINGINVSGYENLQFAWWSKYDLDDTYHWLQRWYSSDGVTWTLCPTGYTGYRDWHRRTANLTGPWSLYYWQFRKLSDYTGHFHHEGAYLDDMMMTGDPISTDPCDSVTLINGCGPSHSQTYSSSGSGVWNVTACGYNTPGQEKVFRFVAPTTGIYSVTVTSASGYWVDYFWKSGSCSSSGWNCIAYIRYPGTYGEMSWTAGTTYFILLDAESTSPCSQQFHINAPIAPSITVIAPNGGETWHVGSYHNILWDTSISGTVNIQLIKNEEWFRTITHSTSAAGGSYNWHIPSGIPTGSDYKVEIRSNSDPTIVDWSDAPFTIVNNQYLQVEVPNGYEDYELGDLMGISWSDNIPDPVAIRLIRNGSHYRDIVLSTPSNGYYEWLIPHDVVPDNTYQIAIVSTADPEIIDWSDWPFTISPPSITVISPNGGETWQVGSSYNILWNTAISGNVNIQLIKNEGGFRTISHSTPAAGGSYSWLIPSGIPTGSDYKVEIRSNSDPIIVDWSDAPFTIVNNQYIQVEVPNGYEEYELGDLMGISWSDNIPDHVAIRLIRNGSHYRDIVLSTPSNGYYEWLIPHDVVPDNTYQIEIVSTADPEIIDWSDWPFTITVFPVEFESPSEGDVYAAGGSMLIAWSSGLDGTVTLNLLRHGYPREPIAVGVDANAAYDWSIPLATAGGDSYQIELVSEMYSVGIAVSNQFSISRSYSTESTVLLTYFDSLPSGDTERILTGLFLGYPNDNFANVIPDKLDPLYPLAPAIVGLDFGNFGDPYPNMVSLAIDSVLALADYGHIVAVSWHACNPWGHLWDDPENPDQAPSTVTRYTDQQIEDNRPEFTALAHDLMSGNQSLPAQTWNASVEQLAQYLVHFRDAGIPVLWRPFHEMNGRWFWWGDQDSIAFRMFWMHMHEVFANPPYELDNLIWVYSPNEIQRDPNDPEIVWTGFDPDSYPGDRQVDMLGVDYYGVDLELEILDLLRSLAPSKPIGIAEYGAQHFIPNDGWDGFDYCYSSLVASLGSPSLNDVSFCLVWGYPPLDSSFGAEEFLHNDLTVNVTGLPWFTPSQETGACCSYTGDCQVLEENECQDVWLGAGVLCSPNPCPSLSVAPSSLAFGNVPVETNSPQQPYSLTGSNLVGNVTVTAPTRYQVSLSQHSGYTSSLTVVPSGGSVNTTIYVRFNPIQNGPVYGDVTNTSPGATPANVAVSGTGYTPVATGSLLVTLLPPEAVSDGARWNRNDGPWQDSGTTMEDVPVGQHEVGFKEIAGWMAPDPVPVIILENELTEETATYTTVGACCDRRDGACSLRTEHDCITQGGDFEWLGAGTTCDPNPCDPVGACCFEWEIDRYACEIETQYGCEYLGPHSYWLGEGTICEPEDLCSLGACCIGSDCDIVNQFMCGGLWLDDWCWPNPCPGSEQACCYPYGSCVLQLEGECWSGGGELWGPSCHPNPCPGSEGACCHADGSCHFVLEADCPSGFWLGSYTDCDPNPCGGHGGACCDPDGSCEFVLDIECDGDWLGLGVVCNPNPCPPPYGACCLEDTSCHWVVEADCPSIVWLVFMACDPNPCPYPEGACCYSDGSCEVVLVTECAGDWLGMGTVCDPNPCPQPEGACCFFDDEMYVFYCEYVSEESCGPEWSWLGSGTVCDPNPCPDAEGACCCLGSGACHIMRWEECDGPMSYPMEFLGPGTSCDPNPCPQPSTGACCFSDGQCELLAILPCEIWQGGFWQGENTVCDPNPCPGSEGACCQEDGSCHYVLEADCPSGDWLGMGTVCDPNPCDQPLGACCFPDGSCEYVLEADCEGEWLGMDTWCDPNPCPQPEGACCFEDGSCEYGVEADCTTDDWRILEPCDPNPCPVLLGACCLDEDTCLLSLDAECSGTFLGAGTVCDPNPCGTINVEILDGVPHRLQIRSIHPNPTTGMISFGIDLPSASRVKVSVVDVTGKVVATLVNRDFGSGSYLISDIPAGAPGRLLQSGVYFLCLEALGERDVRKFILTR